jgi:hypothetical protein
MQTLITTGKQNIGDTEISVAIVETDNNKLAVAVLFSDHPTDFPVMGESGPQFSFIEGREKFYSSTVLTLVSNAFEVLNMFQCELRQETSDLLLKFSPLLGAMIIGDGKYVSLKMLLRKGACIPQTTRQRIQASYGYACLPACWVMKLSEWEYGFPSIYEPGADGAEPYILGAIRASAIELGIDIDSKELDQVLKQLASQVVAGFPERYGDSSKFNTYTYYATIKIADLLVSNRSFFTSRSSALQLHHIGD